MLKDLFWFWKLRRQLLKEYKIDNLLDRFSQLFGVNFKVDRAARLYAVVNPMLINLKENSTSQIFEYTSEGMTDYTYIKHWVFNKLMAVENMFAAQNLLDILIFDITAIDVDGKFSGNYLIKFTPYNFDDYVKSKKKLFILISSIIGIGAIALIILKIFNII